MANNDNTPQQFDMFVERYPDDYEALLAENEALRSEVARLMEYIDNSDAYMAMLVQAYIEECAITPEQLLYNDD